MLLHDRQGVLATLMVVGNPPDQTRSLLLGCTPQDVSIHRDVGLVAVCPKNILRSTFAMSQDSLVKS